MHHDANGSDEPEVLEVDEPVRRLLTGATSEAIAQVHGTAHLSGTPQEIPPRIQRPNPRSNPFKPVAFAASNLPAAQTRYPKPCRVQGNPNRDTKSFKITLNPKRKGFNPKALMPEPERHLAYSPEPVQRVAIQLREKSLAKTLIEDVRRVL